MISDEERWAAEDANSPRPFAVPAVQGVTADREAVAKFLFETARVRAAQSVGLTIDQLPSVVWANTEQQRWLDDADALLAAVL